MKGSLTLLDATLKKSNDVSMGHEMSVYFTRDYIIETREINLRTNMCHLRALGLQNMCSKVWKNNVFEVPETQRGRSF